MFEQERLVAHADVVEEHEVLVNLPHVSYVGDDGDVAFFCHQADGKKLADTRYADGVYLTEAEGIGLEVVFENDAVRNKAGWP